MILRNSQFSLLPEVVKNLLIINGLFFLGTWSLNDSGIDLVKIFGLHQFQSKDFMPHQLITHMFMHADLTHLFFNMFVVKLYLSFTSIKRAFLISFSIDTKILS